MHRLTERIIVELDFHTAKHTPARTYWRVLHEDKEIELHEAEMLDLIRYIDDNFDCRKTHWTVRYEVLDHTIMFVRYRISNRGNKYVSYISPQRLRREE
ncbi:MAG: hypothetical protein LZ173_09700 [Thaumarchaeota archaeon]|jgi:hypothetical protein|nr:hypothetical protein [Candidatus Geocrenenecus arthurdayi]